MREGTLVRVSHPRYLESNQHKGKIGVIYRANSYGGDIRFLIPRISKEMYFLEEELETVDLDEVEKLINKARR